MKLVRAVVLLTSLTAGCVSSEILSRIVMVTESTPLSTGRGISRVQCASVCLRRPVCVSVTVGRRCFIDPFSFLLLSKKIGQSMYNMFGIDCFPGVGCYFLSGPMNTTFQEAEELCAAKSNASYHNTVYRSNLLSIRSRFQNSVAVTMLTSINAPVGALGLYQDENLRWRWSDGSPITFTLFDGVVGDGSQMPTTNVQGTAGRSYAVLHTSGERKGQWQSYSMEVHELGVICSMTPN